MSRLDPFFDQVFIDLDNEIKTIQEGLKQATSFSLFKFVNIEDQNTLTVAEFGKSFANVHKYDSTLEFLTDHHFSQPEMLRNFIYLQKSYNLLKLSIETGLYYATEHCILQQGTPPLLTTTIYLTFKRFHQQFGLKNFLFCHIQNNSYFQIYRQMVQSRLNFMLHGEYLPIIVTFSGQRHTTSLLILPITEISDDDDVTWHFVHINSNGNNIKWKERFENIPHEAFQAYILFFRMYRHKSIFKESNCVENIQKNYGSCAPWSILLAFFLFANIDSFKRRKLDFIPLFCRKIALVASTSKTLHRFHQCIIDFMFSCQHLTLEVFLKATKKVDKLTADNINQPIVTFEQFVKELIYGNPSHTIQLEIKILQTMRKIQERFEKYVKTDSEQTVQESDEETETEKKYTHDFDIQKRQFIIYDSQCNENQEELIKLKDEIQRICKEPIMFPDKCGFSRLKQKFREKAREQLLMLRQFAKRGQSVQEWLQVWFENKIKQEIRDCAFKIQKLRHDLEKQQSIDIDIDVAKYIESLIEKKAQLISKISKGSYVLDAENFLKFTKGIELSQTKLNTIQKVLIDLKSEVEKLYEDEANLNREKISDLKMQFRNKFNELVLNIEQDFGCGKDSREWLEEWFKSDIFKDIEKYSVLIDMDPESRDIDKLKMKQAELWKTYRDDSNKKFASDFLTFVENMRKRSRDIEVT